MERARCDGGRLRRGRPAHVVEQDDVGGGDEHLIELVQIVEFDFDEQWLAGPLGGGLLQEVSRSAHGFGGRETLGGGEREMVVLDEYRVEEAGAMIAATAAVDGIFLEPSPAGRRLAGVVNVGRGAGDLADVLASECGDAREAAEQIQERPFADEHVASGARELGNDGPGRHFISIYDLWR